MRTTLLATTLAALLALPAAAQQPDPLAGLQSYPSEPTLANICDEFLAGWAGADPALCGYFRQFEAVPPDAPVTRLAPSDRPMGLTRVVSIHVMADGGLMACAVRDGIGTVGPEGMCWPLTPAGLLRCHLPSASDTEFRCRATVAQP